MLSVTHKYEYKDNSSGHELEIETQDNGGVVLHASNFGNGPQYDRGYQRVRIELPASAVQELYRFFVLAGGGAMQTGS